MTESLRGIRAPLPIGNPGLGFIGGYREDVLACCNAPPPRLNFETLNPYTLNPYTLNP